jgi:hypothetical protein
LEQLPVYTLKVSPVLISFVEAREATIRDLIGCDFVLSSKQSQQLVIFYTGSHGFQTHAAQGTFRTRVSDMSIPRREEDIGLVKRIFIIIAMIKAPMQKPFEIVLVVPPVQESGSQQRHIPQTV